MAGMTDIDMSARPELGDIREGDQVFVWTATYGRKRRPGERPIPAMVTKTSRVWLELESAEAGWRHPRTWRMRRDTQGDGTRGTSGSEDLYGLIEAESDTPGKERSSDGPS